MTGGFQTGVGQVPAVGVEGDFASANPVFTFLAGPGGLQAGPNGVTVGRFAWAIANPADADGTPASVSNSGLGLPSGFVGRNGQPALITSFLADASMVIPAGYGMSLMIGGDYWVKNAGTTQAVNGQKAFANVNTGQVSFAAAGSNPGGGSGATASIAAETWSATLSKVTGNILDTSGGVVTGSIYPGSYITSSGVVGTVLSQLTGTALGAGTYLLDTGEQTITSQTIAGAYGLLSNGTVTGAFAVGQVLSGTGVVTSPPTVITYIASGAGGTGGTSVVNNNTVVSSTTIVGSNSIETKYYARSIGLPGELVKMSPTATA
jgi:hypothetical protein